MLLEERLLMKCGEEDHDSHLLNMEDKAHYPYVGLYDEVVRWRAVLRLSSYFNREREEDNVYNIYGEILFTDSFWKLEEQNVHLQNIPVRLSYIRVKPSIKIDDLLHYLDSDLDFYCKKKTLCDIAIIYTLSFIIFTVIFSPQT